MKSNYMGQFEKTIFLADTMRREMSEKYPENKEKYQEAYDNCFYALQDITNLYLTDYIADKYLTNSN